MNIAAEARAAALQVEVKKDGLSQLQDGSWVLKLKVHPSDMPAPLLTAPMGTRYVAALVEVSDDETPISPHEQATRMRPAKDKKRWSELPLSQQAAIRCNELDFQTFIHERFAQDVDPDPAVAAEVVRERCGVRSRRDIDPAMYSGRQWQSIDADYRFWLQHRGAA